MLDNIVGIDNDKDVIALNLYYDYMWMINKLPAFQEKYKLLGYKKYHFKSQWYYNLY